MDDELKTLRATVSEGHRKVSVGRYAEAIRLFAHALPALRARLGVDHPEVEELLDDLRTVHDMAGVADFVDGLDAAERPPGAVEVTGPSEG